MIENILVSLMKRPGLEDKEEILRDMIRDSVEDMRTMLNYSDEEDLPEGCIPAIKDLTMVHFNQDGVEGIHTESHSSGGSTTYLNALPARVKRTVYRYRRMRR